MTGRIKSSLSSPVRRFMLVLALVALVIIPAGGCARVAPPGPGLADRLKYDQHLRENYRLDPEWWRNYGDERLNALIELALKNNQNLAQAALSVNRALFQAGLVSADLAPTFSGGLNASSRKDLKQGGPAARSFSGQAGLSYEVDLWRKVAASASAAKWEYKATVEDLEAARLTLINKVVDAYYNLAYLSDALAAGQEDMDNFRVLAEKARARYQAGKAAELEPLQAEQALLNAENSQIGYRNQRQTTLQALRNLLNLKPGDHLDQEGLTLDGVEPPPPDLRIPLAVLANRPDLKAAESRLQKAFAEVETAEKAWLPDISLETAIASSAEAIGQLLSRPVGSIGLALNLPFLDWSRVINRLRLAEADFESLKLSFETALTTALNEVDTSGHNYRTAREMLENTRQKYAREIRIADHYLARYQSGAAELSDWLNAANSANASRLATLNALYQLIAAGNQTYQALGGRYLGPEDYLPAAASESAGKALP